MKKSSRILKFLALIIVILLVLGGVAGFLVFRKIHKMMDAMMQPAPGKVASQYDPTPVPVNMRNDELAAKIQGVKNSLFFLDRSSFFGKVNVDVDSFLLPNASLAKMHFTWTKLVSEEGKDILRAPTAKETADDSRSEQSPHIYVSDKEASPAWAQGSVQLQIPYTFNHVTFTASEEKTTRHDGTLSATLVRCQNNVATLKLQGITDTHAAILVFRDATGGRLEVSETSSSSVFGSNTVTSKAAGTIANIEVFSPVAYTSATLDVLASAEPKTFNVETIDVKSPRYVKDGQPVQAAALDSATLKAQMQVLARRNYAMFGFNTPEVDVILPRTLNSAFAQVDFGEPKLLDSTGAPVPYTLEHGCFTLESCSNEVRFTGTDEHHPVEFAHAVGTLHVHYPGKLTLVTLTSAQPRHGALEAQFHGAKVLIRGIGTPPEAGGILPEHLAPIRAYDASGRQLKKLSYSSYSSDFQEFAFWGQPTEVRVLTVDQWLTLDLPFDLPPAAKLPVEQIGSKPAGYD